MEKCPEVYRRNNNGPKTLPCGTPDTTLTSLLRHPSTKTYCDRLDKKCPQSWAYREFPDGWPYQKQRRSRSAQSWESICAEVDLRWSRSALKSICAEVDLRWSRSARHQNTTEAIETPQKPSKQHTETRNQNGEPCIGLNEIHNAIESHRHVTGTAPGIGINEIHNARQTYNWHSSWYCNGLN